MNPFKIGDRVKAYSIIENSLFDAEITGTVAAITGKMVYIFIYNSTNHISKPFHYKQCRKLKPKKRFPRKGDIWISDKGIKAYISEINEIHIHYFIIDNNRILSQYMTINHIYCFKKYLGTWEIKENLIKR